jgi:DNA-binding response OmpR family regulator
MRDSSTILLVDDEDSVQKLLTYPLERDGFRVVQARDGEQALRLFEGQQIDLVVLDLMLPKVDGLEVCKVLGLELGADDYITKPFSIREFRSRVRALLRRASLSRDGAPRDGEVIKAGELRVDPAKRTVELGGESVQLTYVEFELLRTLAAEPGRVFSRDMLLRSLWGDSAYREPRTIDVHIRHLREKLERDASEPEYIFTVRGVGYRFRD